MLDFSVVPLLILMLLFRARNSKEIVGFEPVNVTRDTDSFYRTISMLFYGDENSFHLIKLGVIAFGIVNAEQLSSIVSQLFFEVFANIYTVDNM